MVQTSIKKCVFSEKIRMNIKNTSIYLYDIDKCFVWWIMDVPGCDGILEIVEILPICKN